MKPLLVTTALWLAVTHVCPATTYSFTLNPGYNLVGSSLTPGETFNSYLSPLDFDEVLPYDFNLLSCNVAISEGGTWYDNNSGDPLVPGDPPFPLGRALWLYFSAPPIRTVSRTFTPGLPTPIPPLIADHYYLLASQVPQSPPTVPADYGDLVGLVHGTGPNPAFARTFVWRFNNATANYEVFRWKNTAPVWTRYNGSSLVNVGPAIPLGEGAIVARFSAGGAPPILSTVTVLSAGCPPVVTLRVTFTAPVQVDPVGAADPSNYRIYQQNGTSIGGSVTAAIPEYSAGACLSTVIAVDLTVSLSTQPGNFYYVGAPLLRSVGGVLATGILQFNPYNCAAGVPANYTPSAATPLTLVGFAATVDDSLKCAGATPSGIVSAFGGGAGANAKNLWYSFTPQVSGSVTLDTCQTPPSGCLSDTVLTVYQGSPAALYPISGTWFNDNNAGCTPRSKLTFTAQACTTYYIRVSGHATGLLPGDFRLHLVETPTSPLNITCGTAVAVSSANSSTPFTVPASGSVWFKFTAPPGVGPWPTDVESCQGGLSSAVTVFSDTCIAVAAAVNCPATLSFLANAGAVYRVRVDNLTANPECGFLHISSGIPGLGTKPPPGPCVSKSYTILGTGTGSTWTWSLTAPPPCALNIQGTATTVLGDSAQAIANEFIASINNNIYNTSPGVPISAYLFSFSSIPQKATFNICLPSPCAASGLVLKVGPSGNPNCWVNLPALAVGVPPCSFNPDIFAIGDPAGVDMDCNGNGQADYLDILNGTSTDADGNGIPDECQGCAGVAVVDGPDTTIGNLGGSATLTVHPIGTAPFNYQWRKDGTPLLGQTGATLSLTNLALDDAGLYDAVVTNACGQDTSPSAVLVVDSQPYLNVARQGTNVVLTWSALDYHLQSASALGTPSVWTAVAGDSPVTLPLIDAARFLRLLQDNSP